MRLEDSGERREFDTGSVRDRAEGKGRYDLVSPFALRRLARHYELGAEKYEERNWEKGQPFSAVYDSMVRHAQRWLAGERGEDHLAAVAWNAFALMHFEELLRRGRLPRSLDDRPDWRPEGTEDGLRGPDGLQDGVDRARTGEPFWQRAASESVEDTAAFPGTATEAALEAFLRRSRR